MRGRKISQMQILQQGQIGYADSPRWQTESFILRFKRDYFFDLCFTHCAIIDNRQLTFVSVEFHQNVANVTALTQWKSMEWKL